MRDGVQIKATLVSKQGPDWEQQLLARHKQRVLVSVPKGAPISVLKEKLVDKFTSTNLVKLNGDSELLEQLGVERITGATISSIATADGFDIDEDDSLEELFGSNTNVVMEVQAEIDLEAILVEPSCCGIC